MWVEIYNIRPVWQDPAETLSDRWWHMRMQTWIRCEGVDDIEVKRFVIVCIPFLESFMATSVLLGELITGKRVWVVSEWMVGECESCCMDSGWWMRARVLSECMENDSERSGRMLVITGRWECKRELDNWQRGKMFGDSLHTARHGDIRSPSRAYHW